MKVKLLTFVSLAMICITNASPIAFSPQETTYLRTESTTPETGKIFYLDKFRINTKENNDFDKSDILKRANDVTLDVIETGFRGFLKETSLFYKNGEIDKAQFEAKYKGMENRAMGLLSSLFSNDFPNSPKKESVCDLTRVLSDKFEKLIKDYEQATGTKYERWQ